MKDVFETIAGYLIGGGIAAVLFGLAIGFVAQMFLK